VRVVRSHEIDTAFHQAGDEMNVPGQSIKLGDDQGGLGLLGCCDGRRKLRPAKRLRPHRPRARLTISRIDLGMLRSDHQCRCSSGLSTSGTSSGWCKRAHSLSVSGRKSYQAHPTAINPNAIETTTATASKVQMGRGQFIAVRCFAASPREQLVLRGLEHVNSGRI
jgi:hypothetical protein